MEKEDRGLRSVGFKKRGIPAGRITRIRQTPANPERSKRRWPQKTQNTQKTQRRKGRWCTRGESELWKDGEEAKVGIFFCLETEMESHAKAQRGEFVFEAFLVAEARSSGSAEFGEISP
jgi:hypothetical protein